jgi:carbamoyl-phosphate synthase large subunit
MDNDAAGVFNGEPPDGIITAPLDEDSIVRALEELSPRAVYPACAGKEIQGIVVRSLEKAGAGDLLPGGAGAWLAATDWQRFRESAEKAGVAVPYGRVARSIEEAASVAAEVSFPVFLSASAPRGGGGARIVYNHEELTAEMARLVGWSLTGEVLVVRVHEHHSHCQVLLLRDEKGGVETLGVVDVLGRLGVHISNSPLVFPGEGTPSRLADELSRLAARMAESVGLVGYGAFHFAADAQGNPYAVGMRTGFGASPYMVSLGLGLDVARAATAVAFGERAASAVSGAADTPMSVVSAPRFDFDLFPGAGELLGPHKTATGRGVGMAETFRAAFLSAERSSRAGAASLFDSAARRAEGPDALSVLAGSRAGYTRDMIAAILQGNSIEQVSAATGIGRRYVEDVARLVRLYRDLKRSGDAAGVEAAAAAEAGFAPGEIAETVGLSETSAAESSQKPVIKRGGSGKRLIVAGPPALSVGGADESDVLLAGLCRAFAGRGYGLAFAGWRSQMPLDLFFLAEEIYLSEPDEALGALLSGKGGEVVYVDPRCPHRERLLAQVEAAGAQVVGPSAAQLDLLSDRKAFARLLSEAGLVMKEGREVADLDQAREAAGSLSYPVLVRTRKPKNLDAVAYDEGQLKAIFETWKGALTIERFLEDMVECAAVVVSDGQKACTVAVVEVLEESGISSADCAGVLPLFSVPQRAKELLSSRSAKFVASTGVKGLVTVRLGLRYDVPYFLSATAGGTREAPFTAFAAGLDLPGAVAAVFDGQSIDKALPGSPRTPEEVYVRQPVFSFDRFPGADTVLTTRPRSTGDVLGTGKSFPLAFANARRAARRPLPSGGKVFISLRDRDKRDGMLLGPQLRKAGFDVVATEGTAKALAGAGVDARVVYRVSEGRPNVIDLIKNGEITLVIYTPAGRVPREDEVQIRTVAWSLGIPVITTVGEATAAVRAIEAMRAAK